MCLTGNNPENFIINDPTGTLYNDLQVALKGYKPMESIDPVDRRFDALMDSLVPDVERVLPSEALKNAVEKNDISKIREQENPDIKFERIMNELAPQKEPCDEDKLRDVIEKIETEKSAGQRTRGFVTSLLDPAVLDTIDDSSNIVQAA